jgi:hypothetical protein
MLFNVPSLALALLWLPFLQTEELSFSPTEMAPILALITVPLGILLLLLARVFWHGRYLGLFAGYKDYGVADPRKMGRFVGTLVGALGLYQIVFPVTVRFWGEGALVAFIFVIVGIGLAILIGGAHYERG